jgi:hypothetical protein
VFIHDETGAINVVYRREDDTYGLIDTSVKEAGDSAAS